jgi:hypothetical protein
MEARHGSYKGYSLGCALVWVIILAITAGADESKRRTIQLTCAGWWLDWLSAAIGRQVYPPPRRWLGRDPNGVS